jgi:SAM-dependent methyltransferase
VYSQVLERRHGVAPQLRRDPLDSAKIPIDAGFTQSDADSQAQNMSDQPCDSAASTALGRMMELIWPGGLLAQAVYVAARLGIPDLVKDGAKSAEAIARATGAHAPSVQRLLRALASLGVFTESSPGQFRNTELGDLLRADHPASLRNWAMFLSAPFVWQACGALDNAIMTGKPGINYVFGQSFWSYLAEHTDDAAVFNAAMSAGAEMTIPWILDAYDFSRFAQVVDVGGGHGALLEGILSRNQNIRGVLFDLPSVVEGAASLRRSQVAHRCDIRGGDFLEGVPEGADAYVLNRVIHDWPDHDAVRILKNCRRAIRPDGRVLVIDLVLTPSTPAGRGQDLMDLLMLTLVGGRERSERDFRALLHDAGFSVESVIRTAGPSSIVEARPT